MKKVLITSNSFGKYSNEAHELLLKEGYEVIYNKYKRQMSEKEFIEELNGCEAVILSTEELNKTVIDSSPMLKYVSRYGVGSDNIDLDYCELKGIKVSFALNANSEAVAEYAIALILASMKGICEVNQYARQNNWKKVTGLNLTDKTIGVVGLGSIGKLLVKKLIGFDLKVLAYDVFYDEEFVEKYDVEKVSFKELLERSDVITLHIPAMDSKPMISYEEFELMKDNVVIVNTARAALIDFDALKSNLMSGKVFSVGLDVHENEPNYDKELILYENVILTPHNAAISKEAIDKTSLIAVENLIKSI